MRQENYLFVMLTVSVKYCDQLEYCWHKCDEGGRVVVHERHHELAALQRKSQISINTYLEFISRSPILINIDHAAGEKYATLTYRRDIDESNEKLNSDDSTGNMPELSMGKLIVNDGDDTGSEGSLATNPQHEHHHEEDHSEELGEHRELGDGIGVRDEGQTGTTSHHSRDVVGTELVCQVAQNTEDRAAG